MAEIRVIFWSDLRSGPRQIDAWANAEDAQLAVHFFVTEGGTSEHHWVVSHRRSGRAITQYSGVSSKAAALDLAAVLEPAAPWSRLNERAEGWTSEDWAAAKQAVDDVVTRMVRRPLGAALADDR